MGLINYFKNFGKKRIGLALSGGGTKGFAHIGAIKALEELGLSFDAVAGTSVGSLVGALYCAGMSSAEMLEIANKLEKKDIKLNIIPFMPSKTEGIENIITENLSVNNIENLKIPFTAVAVNMKNGEEVHFKKGSIAKAVAGSCAVPMIFNPVELNDMLLADGGLLNNVPASVVRQMNCDYVVTIDLDSTRGSGTESTKLFDLIMASISIMMKSNSLKGKLNSDILITPNIKRFKSSSLLGSNEMVMEGYNAVMEQKRELLFLFKKAKKIKNI